MFRHNPYPHLTVIMGEGEIPTIPFPDLLERFRNYRVGWTFVTEDDMSEPQLPMWKARDFMRLLGIDEQRVYVIVAIAKNPTTRWGAGFPYQVRISIFPRCEETVALPRVINL